jgi:hypothetical protein
MVMRADEYETFLGQVQGQIEQCGLEATFSVSKATESQDVLRLSWPATDGRWDAVDFPATAEWVNKICSVLRAFAQERTDGTGRPVPK